MVADKREPWSKFYWADWRSDPKLRACSLAARGLWCEMLALMHEATPYGHLLVIGKAPSDQKLAEMVGAKASEIRKLKKELAAAGVPDVTADGVWVSRRMVRDAKRRAVNRENGKTGGNPLLTGKGSDNPDPTSGGYPKSDGAAVKPKDKSRDARDPDTRYQNRDSSPPSSLASERDETKLETPPAEPTPPVPPFGRPPEQRPPVPGAVPEVVALIAAFDEARVEVWGAERRRAWPAPNDSETAKRWIGKGVDGETVRSVALAVNGRFKSEGGEPTDSLKAIERWIAGALRERETPMAEPLQAKPQGQRHGQQQGSGLHPGWQADQWRGRLKGFVERGLWLANWGPKPGEERCEAPAEILAEFKDRLPPDPWAVPAGLDRRKATG